MKKDIAVTPRHTASRAKQHLAHSFRTLLFLLAAGMFLFSCDEKIDPSSEASMTSLTLTIAGTDYDVTFTGKEGKITLPSATELPATATVKAVVLSAKATGVKVGDTVTIPVSGTVTLTVTAEDDKTKGVYTLTVEKASASTEALITSLTLTVADSDYKIDFTDRAYTLVLPVGSTLPTAVEVKAITLAAGAVSDTGNGTALTVSDNAVTITVTAADGETESTYTVTLSLAANVGAAITSLILTVGDSDYEITFQGTQGRVTLPSGTALPTKVGVKEIALSAGAASDTGNGTELTVSDNAVTLTVTAEDGTTTNTYTVTLVVSQATAGPFTSFKFTPAGNEAMALEAADRKEIAGTINDETKNITFPKQSAYVYLNRLKASFTASAGATVQVGGADQVSGVTEQDFSSPVSYVVRTQDGTETTYTVTLTKSTMATIPDAQFRAKLKEFVPAAFTEDQLNIKHDALVNNRGVWDVKNQNPKLTSLKGIEFFTALKELNCAQNTLTALDVSKNTALTDLSCYGNSLTSLDVSKNTALTYLDCSTNSLSSLEVSENTTLKQLYFSNNSIASLDLSKNTVLTGLYCNNSGVNSLDVSANTLLTQLSCSNNRLSSLDVRSNTALTELYCSFNTIGSLDMRSNTALTRLDCADNTLPSLDVSANTALTRLDCADNTLPSLDVSANTALTHLKCNRNRLTSLNMTGMRSIDNLDIGSGTGTENPLLATLRVNTAVQNYTKIVTIKTNRGAALTVTTVNDAGTVVCADYTPAQGGGTCN